MKIGIMTQPLHNNYGGLLQNFALQKVLKDLGHNPVTINIPFPNKFRMRAYRLIKSVIKRFILMNGNVKILSDEPNYRDALVIGKHTSKFVREKINCTHLIKDEKAVLRFDYREFGAFVVGSDQVWRPIYSPSIDWYFLSFLCGEKTIKKIAYAASFGVDFWEFDEERTRKCRELAKRFDSISVREKSGVELCEKYLGVKAVQMPDPTLLLNADEYKSLFTKNVGLCPYVFEYMLDIDENKRGISGCVANSFGVAIKSGLPKIKYKREHRGNIEDCIYGPVEEWLSGICDSKFVVTDSFHGVVFSVIFNKQFVVVGNKERGLARIESLLADLGLLDRIVADIDDVKNVLEKNIIYNDVNGKVEIMRERGLEFLRLNLN